MTLVRLTVTGLKWLSASTFEVRFARPLDFDFLPGQKVRFFYQDDRREYTLLNAPDGEALAICVRRIPGGRFSTVLAKAEKGDRFQTSLPFGYFLYQLSPLPAVFVATGTGVAPFVAYARNGVRDFCLLHGVHSADELYYRDILESTAASYIPCLSEDKSAKASLPQAFHGRVTKYMEAVLPKGSYDFYLCGRSEMIADATRVIDEKFHGSKVFTETFY